ncbi:MAG: nucleotidyltransferase [Chloroflexota bacterium]
MLTKELIMNRLREQKPYLNSEYGVKRMGLFGYSSNGSGSETSAPGQLDDDNQDINMVVEFERPIGFKFVELVDYLEQLFEKHVEVLTPGGIQSIRVPSVAERIQNSIVYV